MDTSVISHLEAVDVPEKMEITQLFWKDLKTGEYEIFVSEVTKAEISDCPEPKKTALQRHLAEISFHTIMLTV